MVSIQERHLFTAPSKLSMRFSLIVATFHRTTELRRLLLSLDRQTHRNFEVIVVDQNADGRLWPILDSFAARLEIHRVTSARGLSRARNVGLRCVTGDVVCFPDDDCWYPENLLEDVNRLLTEDPESHGIIADSLDESGRQTLRWSARPGKLTTTKSWLRSISYAIFLRKEVLVAIGGFDEAFGVGSSSRWESGEDNDLVLRSLKAGFTIHYERDVCVFHPKMFLSFDDLWLAKRYKYALGEGKLAQKHPMPLWWQALFFLIPLSRALLVSLLLNGNRAYFHWLTFSGRLVGFRSSEELHPVRIPFPLGIEPVLHDALEIPLKVRSAATSSE